MNESWTPEDLFRVFVLQQQQMAMVHMGKLVHPVSGQIERDLDSARIGIDMLAMLEAKTKGNLLPDEERMLGQVLTTLRLNFVEEANRAAHDAQRAEAEDGVDAERGAAGAPGRGTEPSGSGSGTEAAER